MALTDSWGSPSRTCQTSSLYCVTALAGSTARTGGDIAIVQRKTAIRLNALRVKQGNTPFLIGRSGANLDPGVGWRGEVLLGEPRQVMAFFRYAYRNYLNDSRETDAKQCYPSLTSIIVGGDTKRSTQAGNPHPRRPITERRLTASGTVYSGAYLDPDSPVFRRLVTSCQRGEDGRPIFQRGAKPSTRAEFECGLLQDFPKLSSGYGVGLPTPRRSSPHARSLSSSF
jgi:hypothetical protein